MFSAVCDGDNLHGSRGHGGYGGAFVLYTFGGKKADEKLKGGFSSSGRPDAAGDGSSCTSFVSPIAAVKSNHSMCGLVFGRVCNIWNCDLERFCR